MTLADVPEGCSIPDFRDFLVDIRSRLKTSKDGPLQTLEAWIESLSPETSRELVELEELRETVSALYEARDELVFRQGEFDQWLEDNVHVAQYGPKLPFDDVLWELATDLIETGAHPDEAMIDTQMVVSRHILKDIKELFQQEIAVRVNMIEQTEMSIVILESEAERAANHISWP